MAEVLPQRAATRSPQTAAGFRAASAPSWPWLAAAALLVTLLAVLPTPGGAELSLQTGNGGCNHKPFDLIVVLDSSGSLGPDQWEHELEFAAGLIMGLPVAEDVVR